MFKNIAILFLYRTCFKTFSDDDDDFRKKCLNALLLFEEKLFLVEFCMCELINYMFLTRTSHILKKIRE